MSLLPVEEARSRILTAVEPTLAEQVSLLQAPRRILAQALAATRDQPPFAASAMDGYAVRAQDVKDVPVILKLAGELAAGTSYEGSVQPGHAVRIFTGAPLPDGADTVIIQENTSPDGDCVTILEAAPKARFVRPRALDFKQGEVLLEAGTRLGSREIALAAAMNQSSLPVRRKPRIALLPTGDELVTPGSEPGPEQIISSNNYGIAAFIENCGGTAADLGIAPDEIDALRARIDAARDFDVLVTFGGASVGDHDLVHRALTDSGMEPDFWKIAMRPGKPLMFGRIGGLRVLGLPGNPVSAFVCAHVFLRPLIDALLGIETHNRQNFAVLGKAMGENDERQDYVRAQLSEDDQGSQVATPFDKQDSSMLRIFAAADCLVVRPPHDKARAAGDKVRIVPIDF